MMRFTYILLVLFVAIFITIDARSIQQDSDIELLVTNRVNADKKLSTIVANYRHRFEHSPSFKALRWTLSEQLNPPYCEFCDIFVPVVSLMCFYLFKRYDLRFRFGFLLKSIRRLTLKMSLLLYVEISNFFLILMFVLEPYMNIG